MIYPSEIASILINLEHAASKPGNCVGTEANFSCGSVVQMRFDIEPQSRVIRNTSFTSNGCGWMVAAAEAICEFLSGKNLTDLHGLDDVKMLRGFGSIKIERPSCVSAALSSARAALSDFRSRQLEEFRGEKALICTCFGVTEERIETAIAENKLTTVEQVGEMINAGTGCGSCRMLIEEMIDGRNSLI